MKDLCYNCKRVQDVAATHPASGRPYCAACAQDLPWSLDDLAMFLLTVSDSPVGPPFRAGDVVECRAAGVLYEGVGVVQEMDMNLEHGGTPLYPMFRVTLTDKASDSAPDEAWYAEVSLTKVAADAEPQEAAS